MLNFALMKTWENWIIIFLMIAIFLVGMHIFVDYFGSKE